MSTNDDFADKYVDNYVISTGLSTEFLLGEVGEPPGEDPGPVGPISEAIGDVYLAIDSATRRVVSVSFHIAGVSAVGTGIFDLQGRQSEQQSDTGGGWIKDGSFALDVEAAYLDEYIVFNNPLEQVESDVFVSPRDFYRGQLRGKLTLEGEMIILRDTWLMLIVAPEQRQYGVVGTLQVRNANSSGTNTQPPMCGQNFVAVYRKHLQLEVVRFTAPPGGAGATGTMATVMLSNAQQLWQPGLIDWKVDKPAAKLDSTLACRNPTKNDELLDLWRSRSNQSLGWIPIFFVRFDLLNAGDGGGVMRLVHEQGMTTNPQTVLATISISENACDLVLAHELGHVMGGNHPCPKQVGTRWCGDVNTIMSPAVPRNSTNNCARAISPVPGTAAQSVPQCLPRNTWSILGYGGCPNPPPAIQFPC